jgi:hypothetical protein
VVRIETEAHAKNIHLTITPSNRSELPRLGLNLSAIAFATSDLRAFLLEISILTVFITLCLMQSQQHKSCLLYGSC